MIMMQRLTMLIRLVTVLQAIRTLPAVQRWAQRRSPERRRFDRVVAAVPGIAGFEGVHVPAGLHVPVVRPAQRAKNEDQQLLLGLVVGFTVGALFVAAIALIARRRRATIVQPVEVVAIEEIVEVPADAGSAGDVAAQPAGEMAVLDESLVVEEDVLAEDAVAADGEAESSASAVEPGPEAGPAPTEGDPA